MNKKLIQFASINAALFAPFFAFAQAQPNHLYSIIDVVSGVVNRLIPIVLAVIFLMIVWNGYKMINEQGEEKSDYKQSLIRSIVIFFVIVSLWGIIFFIGRTLGIGHGGGLKCVTGVYNPVTKACE